MNLLPSFWKMLYLLPPSKYPGLWLAIKKQIRQLISQILTLIQKTLTASMKKISSN